MKRAYICQPTSEPGIPQESLDITNKLANHVAELGYTVLSPSYISDPTESWSHNMRRALRLLLEADILILGSEHWRNSKSCCIEILLAELLEITVYRLPRDGSRYLEPILYPVSMRFVLGRLLIHLLRD